jgi:Na+-transporting NADH:ubiquinone oxidoreductase subunit NqrF
VSSPALPDASDPPQSYEKGNISRHVSLLKIGDLVKVRGPKGFFKYSPTLSRHIGMIAGGTGITPMLQIIRAALKNPADRTKLSLIYANVNPDDILLRKELDDLAARYPHRFSVYYVLNNPPEIWSGGVGFVSKDQIEKYIPRSSSDIKVLLCGTYTALDHLTAMNIAPRSSADDDRNEVRVHATYTTILSLLSQETSRRARLSRPACGQQARGPGKPFVVATLSI